MKTQHQTSIGIVEMYLHSGIHTAEKDSDREYTICFQANRENPVTINGVPYQFSWTFKKGTRTNCLYNWFDNQLRYEYFSSDRIPWQLNNGMTGAARKKLEKICKELFDTIKPEDYREAERVELENAINREQTTINELHKEIDERLKAKKALQDKYVKLFGKAM